MRAPRPQRYFDQSLLSSRFLDETWYQRWRSLREAWPRTLRRRHHETGPRNEGRQLVVILGLANSSSSRHSLEEKSYLLFLELLLFLGLALFRCGFSLLRFTLRIVNQPFASGLQELDSRQLPPLSVA